MKNKSPYLGIWAMISFFVFFPLAIQAAPKVTIKPKMSASWRRDNNYFGGESIERAVDTYLFQPGIELGINTAKSSLLLDYTLDVYDYHDKDSVPPGERPADDFDFVGNTGVLQARYRPFDRLLVGLDESLYKSREPARTDPFSVSVDRAKYYINQLEPMVFYDFPPKFTVGVRYRNTQINFKPSDREDSTGHRGMLDLIYNFTRTLSADLGYQHWTREYDGTTSDFTADQVTLTFRKELRYFTISAGGGYQNRDFDDPGLDDIDAFVYRFNFEGEAFFLANRRSYVSFNVAQNFNDYGPNDEYFLATRFTLNAGHEFSKKMSGDVSTYYQISDFERTKGLNSSGDLERREDKTYGVEGSIRYEFARWLTFSITAGHEKRDSNLAGFDFDNTFYTATLGFAYSVGKN